MPGVRAAVAAVLGLAGVLAFAGCGPSEEERAAAAEQRRLEASAELVWESGDQLMSDLVWVDDVVLAYVADRGQMQLLAREVATGEELWREPALFGSRDGGRVPAVATVERDGETYAAYYAPVDDGPGELRVVAAASGERVGVARAQPAYASMPEDCGETFCARASWWYATSPDRGSWSPDTHVAFDWELGRWQNHDPAEREIPLVDRGAWMLGDRLSVSPGTDAEAAELGYGRDGEIAWTRTYSEVFGDGYELEAGWGWYDSEGSPLVGTAFGHFETSEDGTTTVFDLPAVERTVRLDRETGETLWSVPGTSRCEESRLDEELQVLVVCGYAEGTLTRTDTDEGPDLAEEGVVAYVAGIDLETGDELWRVETGTTVLDAIDGRPLIAPGAEHVQLVDAAGEALAVSMESGKRSPLAEAFEETVICTAPRESLEVRRFSASRGSGTWSRGDDLVTPPRADASFACNREDRAVAEAAPTVGELRRVGHRNEEYVVLGATDGMVGYRLPESEAATSDT
ncbi:PQQ-binding-like beta-propeller repeat protein [Zhihengliuella sp.]|uniref:outer membrane protein assembly factor BamB family protein n=1 Tax=Zhihengliuella sp. TaxID=1954483 RepID=UPI002811C290|nr:PQQ-binding-like beta-propeller repeat protein [Zhihengliuella sp.]